MDVVAQYQRDVRQYCRDVLAGDVPAGRLVMLAVRRHLTDLRLAGGRGYHFKARKAAFAVAFFETVLRHSTGEWKGKPFLLQPWQKFIVWCVFGWQREDGTRRFRRVHQEIGRKNGKTELLAGVGLLLMEFDDPYENRAEIFCAATMEDQAKRLSAAAIRMVKASPDLKGILKTFDASARLINQADDSTFIAVGSNSDTKDSLEPHGVLLDELHAWRKQHRGLFEKLTTGGASRAQPLEWIITTAGDDQSELWQEKRSAAVRVLESVLSGAIVNDEMFAYIACVDEDDDPLGERLDESGFRKWLQSEAFDRVMAKANPNLRVSVKRDYLVTKAVEARNDPADRNKFIRYHANRTVSSVEKAIRADLWIACKGELSKDLWPKVSPRGGFDIARSDDFCAASIIFPIPTGQFETAIDENDEEHELEIIRFEAISRAWTCESRPEALNNPQFKRWVDEDRLEVHVGDQIDFLKVSADIVSWTREHNVRSWAYDDSWARMVAQYVKEQSGLDVYPFYQTHLRYNEATRGFLRLIKDPRRFRHDGDELLAWQADNLAINKDNKDRWMPEKAGTSEKKIDGMVALIMAYSECLFHDDSTSVYDREGRGFVTLG